MGRSSDLFGVIIVVTECRCNQFVQTLQPFLSALGPKNRDELLQILRIESIRFRKVPGFVAIVIIHRHDAGPLFSFRKIIPNSAGQLIEILGTGAVTAPVRLKMDTESK